MNRLKTLLWVAFFGICLLASSCAQQTQEKERKPIAEHVVLIGLDGWGAYSVPKAEMPTVKQMMADGAYTLEKRSVLPSSSAVNWASMFMGAGPELHGYTTWGSQTPELPSRVLNENGIFPTVFHLLREARPHAEIGCLHQWGGIKYVVDTLALSYREQLQPEELCSAAEKYIKEKQPDLLAVCFDEPDHVGHASGHDTPEYYDKLKELDAYIARIVQSVKDAGMADETIFILTSDHGGINKGHGGKTMQEMQTAFIVCGKGVKKGLEFHESMMQYDVAATIAYIFGLKQPQVWVGRPMVQVFE